MHEDWAVIPLDLPLPPVDLEALQSFLQSHCDGCYFLDNRIRFTLFHARKPIVDGKLLLHTCDPRFCFNQVAINYAWDPIFEHLFPALTNWFSGFPLSKLEVVTFLIQTDTVPEHLDLHGGRTAIQAYEEFRTLEPMSYRVLFTANDDCHTGHHPLYVSKCIGGQRQPLDLPSSTASFALAASTCFHGAEHRPGHFKATAAVSGILDQRRHLELLSRSLRRYQHHAIRLQEPGPVRGSAAGTFYC